MVRTTQLLGVSLVLLATSCIVDNPFAEGSGDAVGGSESADVVGDGDGDGEGSTDTDSSTDADADAGDGDGDASGDGDGGGEPDLPPDDTSDTEPMDCGWDVDLVLVLDVSSSMKAWLDVLNSQLAAVDEVLRTQYAMGTVHYGLVVFVDDVGIYQGGAPQPSLDALQQELGVWAEFAGGNLQINSEVINTTWPENSLDGLHAAATQFQWRPAANTSRLVLHATDDTFWDGPVQANGVAIEHGYAETVAALRAQEVRVLSFADTLGALCECEDVSMGFLTDYMGQASIPAQTGGQGQNINAILDAELQVAPVIEELVGSSYCEDYPPAG